MGNAAPSSIASSPRAIAVRHRIGILASLVLIVFSGVQCVQDLFVGPKRVNYVFTITPDSAVVAVGDTAQPYTATLTADGKTVAFKPSVVVVEGPGVVRADSQGRVIVLARGLAKVRVRPLSIALPVDTIVGTVKLWAVAPRIGFAATPPEDTLYSLFDTLAIRAAPLTRRGDTIRSVPLAWRQTSGAGVVTLLDSAAGKVRAEINGDAEFEATLDTVHARRIVRVRQRPNTLINTADTTWLNAVGHSHALTATVKDRRANAVAGATPTWTSKNAGIASVSGAGVVRAEGEGTTMVIASLTAPSVNLGDTTTVVVRRMRLAVASGSSQLATVGTALTAPLVVQVVDSAGAAIADSGVDVVFKVTGGGAHFPAGDSVLVATDAQGRAQLTPTLGTSAGANTFTVWGPGLAGPAVTFTANGASGKRLRFAVEPTGIVAGGSFVPSVKVEVLDTFGNRVISATDSVRLTITQGTGATGALLGGTVVVVAAGGVATFGAVTVDKVGTGYTLTASAPGLVPDTSAAFTVGSGAADHIVFLVPPRAARAGVSIGPSIQVAIVDAAGNAVTTSVAEVTLSIGRVPQGGSASYFGTPSVTAANGVAVFNDFGLQTAASGYKLKASAAGLLPILSDLFDASGPPATFQMVSGNSQGDTVRAVLKDSLVVRVLDANGVGVPNDTIVFRVTTGGGSFGDVDTLVVLTGAGGRAAAALKLGSATGTDSVTVHSRSLAGQSAAFAATAVEAGLHLEFIVQPASIKLGATFGSPVQVRVRDGFMNTVTSATSLVTLAVTVGTGRAGAAVTGTAVVAAANGVATFPGLGLSRSGVGYTLTATGSSLYPATSTAFEVQQVPVTLAKDWGDYQNSTVGTSLDNNFITRVLDAAGDPIAGDTVVYKVASGVGTLYGGSDSAIAISDALGRALAGLTLGPNPGTVTVSARSRRLAGQSVTYTASATAAGRALEFVTQPTTLIAGSTFSPPIQVRVYDPATGATDATAVTFITLTAPGLGLTPDNQAGGGMVVAAVNGVATFSGVGVPGGGLGTGKRIQASARGLQGVITSNTFDVVAGAPARLVFSPAPAHPTAGEAFWMMVAIQDANGNMVPGATDVITVTITGGTGTAGAHLGGTQVLAAGGGAAVFGNLSIDSVGAGYTLTATAPGLGSVVTDTFSVWPGPAARLRFATRPVGAVAGNSFTPPVDVLVEDALGNLVTSTNAVVSLSLGANPGGGTLLGTTSVAAVGGMASFPDLRLRFAGTGYTLVAASQLFTPATSAAFDVAPAPASRLAFVLQPGNVPPGAAIVPSPKVMVQDSIGNVVTTSNATVAVQISAGTGTAGATLAGTTSVGAVDGIARFTGLSVATAGYNYTLTATAPSLASGVSAPFSILTDASNRLVFKQVPTQLTAGAPVVVTVAVEDGSGTRASGFTGNVALAITEYTGVPGAHLSGTTTVAAVAGLATFSGISVDKTGADFTFTATAAGVASGTSTQFLVLPGAPGVLAWKVQPTSRTAGNLFSPAIEVVALDALGNLAGAGSPVSLAITPGSGTPNAVLAGTTTVPIGSSGAVFADLSIARAGTGYTLTASGLGLNSIVSGTFSIVAGPVARAVVTPDGVSLVAGATQQFAAQAFDQFDNPVNSAALSWISWGGHAATIDKTTGLVTARNAGQAVIGAMGAGMPGTAVVTVSAPDATPVNLWVRMPSGTTSDLTAVWAGSPVDAYAAGQGGTVLRLNGTTGWTSLASGTTASLTSVWGAVFVTGFGGTLRSSSDAGANWQELATGTSDHLMAGWVGGSLDLWAVGQNGAIIRYRDWGIGAVQVPSGVSGWLWGIFGTSRSNIVAVGENGTILRFDGTTWAPMASPTTQNILAVWGPSANSMYAAAGPEMLHWDGSTWSLMSGSHNASGIWGTSDGDVYAVGPNGRIDRYDGAAWQTMTSGTTKHLHSVWGTSTGDVYAVGDSGTILRGVRGANVQVTATGGPTLTALGATKRLVATAVAPGSGFVEGVSYTWTSVNPAVATVDSTGLVTAVANGGTAITATAPGGASAVLGVTVQQVPAYLSTGNGPVLSGVGSSWQASASAFDSRGNPIPGVTVTWGSLNPSVATVDPVTGVVTAVSAGQVVITATAGSATGWWTVQVDAFQGQPVNLWAPMSSPVNTPLEDVWGASVSDVFAVGEGGVILHFDGRDWSRMSSGSSADLHSVWGLSGTLVYAGGSNGTLLRYDGATWSPVPTGVSFQIEAVWGNRDDNKWVGGTGGGLLQSDGLTLVPQVSGTSETLLGLYGVGSVFGVGVHGTILRLDGNHWSPVASGTTSDLTGVWASNPSDYHAVGLSGTVLSSDGSAWSPGTSGTSADLLDVWGADLPDVYAVGAAGTILRYSGSNWAPMSSGTTAQLNGVWGTSPGSFFAVGDAGTILRGYRGATVTVTPASPTLTSLGATQQLVATVRDATGYPVGGVTLTWASGNPSVAAVDPGTGIVTAVANGTATITATAPGGASGSATVTVAQAAASFANLPGGVMYGVGTTMPLTAEVRDSRGNLIPAASLAWESLNPAVATVDPAGGIVRTVGAGQVTIAVRSGAAVGYTQIQVDAFSGVSVNLWAPMSNPAGAEAYLMHVWGLSRSNVYVVGMGGLILHYDGVAWSQMASGTSDNLRSVGGLADSLIWAGGQSGSLFRFNGGGWTREPDPGFSVEAIWGRTPREVYVVGNSGQVRQYDGAAWSPVASGTDMALLSVYSPTGPVYAVGVGGTILSEWTPQASGTAASLEGIWGDPHSLYAVGAGGTILRWDGASWSAMTSGTTALLSSVTGTTTGDVYVVGMDGTILRYDGGAWAPMVSGTTALLTGVWSSPEGDVFAVGTSGTILRGVRGATVTLSPESPTLTVLGTKQLTAEARDASSQVVQNVTYTWSSNNLGVATVDANGVVTAVATGTAKIMVTAPGGATASTIVTVSL